jgi:hypothetical protein
VDSTLWKNKSGTSELQYSDERGRGEREVRERYKKVKREKEAAKSREYTQYKHENETLQIE